MTVDLDLLADYAEGLLEPLDRARVESLVHGDPEWATALAALRSALPSVAAALTAPVPEAMPPAVLAASLRAIAAERDRTARPATAARLARDSTRPAQGRPPNASTSPANPKRLRRPRASAVLAAFALLIVAAVGVGFVLSAQSAQHTSAGPAAKAAAPQVASGGFDGSAGVRIFTSGSNYTQATLPTAFDANGPAFVGPNHTSGYNTESAVPGPTRAPVSPGLARLQPQPALAECLRQVDSVIGGQASTVDYAAFAGTPALIITLPDVDTVVAVGANCGATGFGIDELARS